MGPSGRPKGRGVSMRYRTEYSKSSLCGESRTGLLEEPGGGACMGQRDCWVLRVSVPRVSFLCSTTGFGSGSLNGFLKPDRFGSCLASSVWYCPARVDLGGWSRK